MHPRKLVGASAGLGFGGLAWRANGSSWIKPIWARFICNKPGSGSVSDLDLLIRLSGLISGSIES